MHLITTSARKPKEKKMSNFDDELNISVKIMGVKVKRAPAIFIGEEPKKEKVKRAKSIEERRKQRIEYHKNRENV